MSRDDDLDEPLSTRRALERADHGKKERQERRRQHEQKHELHKLKLSVLRQSVQKPERDDSPKTRGRAEEEKKATDTVHAKDDTERMIQKEQMQQAAEDQAVPEKQQGNVG